MFFEIVNLCLWRKAYFLLRPFKIICLFQVNFFPKRNERGLKQNTNLKKIHKVNLVEYFKDSTLYKWKLNNSFLGMAHFKHLGWSPGSKHFLTDYDHQPCADRFLYDAANLYRSIFSFGCKRVHGPTKQPKKIWKISFISSISWLEWIFFTPAQGFSI